MTTSPWISVKDRLPMTSILVLVAYKEEDYKCRELAFWRGTEWRSMRDYVVPSVTHWMPIPDAPQPEDPFEMWWNGLREDVETGQKAISDHLWTYENVAKTIWNAALASQKT